MEIGVALLGLFVGLAVISLIRFISLAGSPIPDDYCERFMKPAIRRAKELGIPDAELDAMWKIAIEKADPRIIGFAPVALLHRQMDFWEAMHKGEVGIHETRE